MVDLVMTDLLSPNMKLLPLIGTPRYIRVYLRSTIRSTAILAATNSDPYVAVSTVACLLEYQSLPQILISFHGCLCLGIPVCGCCPINNVENGCDRPASDQVMVQFCIHIVQWSHTFLLVQGCRWG